MTDTIIGRGPETARLRQLLTTGRDAVLVVRGAPGIGKTALVEQVAKSAVGHQVVWLRGSPAQADLPYSTLHLLCSALSTQLASLERHRREALETAVGLRAGPVPDRLLVGVATAELLSRAHPLLCVVDDMQWLDAASADVLTFVARRVDAAPVALLFAGRGERFADLPGVVLDGLGHDDAVRLFDLARPAPMDRAVVERIVAEARGNPLVLLESAREVSCPELAGGYGVVAPEHLNDSVPSGLTPDSTLLLVLAAAEPLGDPARLWRAAAALGIAPSAAEQLECESLLSFGPRVLFRDPRLRSSVYGLASPAQRRRAHSALAGATELALEPDRHVWHAAHALVAPDDVVGDELVCAAPAARERGGLAAVAAFLERAALCTAEPGLRVERTIMAADAHHGAGAADAAARLLATAELGPVDERSRARLNRVRARIAFDATRGRAAVAQLLRSAQDFGACDPKLARATYLEALSAAIFAGHVDVLATVLAQLAGQEPRGTDRLLEGVALRCTAGYAAAVEPLKLALKTLDCDHENDTHSRMLACLVAADLWDDDTWHELTTAEVTRARRAGARTNLPYVLSHRALVEVRTGRFAEADELLAEASAITDTAGTRRFSHVAVVLAAWRGLRDPALKTADQGAGMVAAIARYATAVVCNGLGAYGDAVAATRHALDGDALELQSWSLAELVEGAVRSGQPDTAAAAMDRLTERACLGGTDWALGVEARSRALLSDGRAAEELYVEAIERLARSRITTDLARARLVYGEWLRRQGRRVDARVPLRAAHRSFTEMGAEAFAGRALQELLATGERARRRTEPARGQLTPQETRIATLACDGRSNPDIATLLSISPRTVEYHLHKVFTKLDITSRTELHLVLASVPQP
ncbi:MAG TPA: AAA family ATPase [Pseudonocardiaceae bacterium]|jgi:DNA-binding CsgD family transcriptional regulator|nr:AAA family ATPase [Pseudonocardiaceae bacterium]